MRNILAKSILAIGSAGLRMASVGTKVCGCMILWAEAIMGLEEEEGHGQSPKE
jgi:hypothetical protein